MKRAAFVQHGNRSEKKLCLSGMYHYVNGNNISKIAGIQEFVLGQLS